MELRFEGVLTAGGGGGNDSSNESSEKCSSSLLLLEPRNLQSITSSDDPLHTSLCLSIELARVRGGNFVFGDNISPSDLLSLLTFFFSMLLLLDGDILYVGEWDCRLYWMLGPG